MSLEERAYNQRVRYVPVADEIVDRMAGSWSEPVRIRFHDDPSDPRLLMLEMQLVLPRVSPPPADGRKVRIAKDDDQGEAL